ncbi:tetratricopeptide repeat protein [Roseibium denhamense]|uniref:Predicted methyltransferase, contains TPR repeat n=1 Tax=Roseibium denhamense TaxID=76305 RepID=A0ABY1NZ34_9HYPH|nr:tetratricopeptide repeat protein [Roseibium denhamense]MTI05133.1 tetratricopeptide repeat protein [Roseibium denhamense]SMP22484.1 Predicted methyltransferase, contains TPR repeat [Roseibium denhamense]
MQPEDRLQAGIKAHQRGDLQAALAAYKEVLSADPEHPDGLHFLGLLHFDAGKSDNAITLIRKSLENNPLNAAAHNNLGNILKLSDQPEEALGAYVRAVELQPRHEEAWANINMLLESATTNDQLLPVLSEIVRLDPDNPNAWHNYGLSLMLAGHKGQAADALERCLAFGNEVWSDPVWHARVLCALGRQDRAQEHLEGLLTADPDNTIIRYQLAAIRGDDLDQAPPDYVKDHFDSFSDSFDEVLKNLGYRAPDLVAAEVSRLAKDRQTGFQDVIDLGCGTGLCGPLIRDHCVRLTGIDLSPGMLRKAAVLDVYDYLVEGELVAFLTSDLPTQFDLAVCVDTLCYLGALDAFMTALAPALRPGGVLIASVEHLQDDDQTSFIVDATGRYAHSISYLNKTAKEAGLILEKDQKVTLRKELGKEVEGLTFHLRKPHTIPA